MRLILVQSNAPVRQNQVAVKAAIPSPSSNGLQLGPFDVHVYGLLYVVGLAAAVLITVRRWEARGGSRATVYDVAMWGFFAGIVGGRLYFDLTSSGEVPAQWWGPFAVWDGGMGIWGGIALGTAVGVWRLRRAGVPVAAFMDAAAPALLVGQATGRVGNYFNQELFGGPTNLPWALEISPAHRPAGYESFATFQPTFLYELIWNLTLAAFLVWPGHHRRIRPPGLFALYVAGYSGFRIFEESLAGRSRPPHPWSATQLLRCSAALYRWACLVRLQPGLAADSATIAPGRSADARGRDCGLVGMRRVRPHRRQHDGAALSTRSHPLLSILVHQSDPRTTTFELPRVRIGPRGLQLDRGKLNDCGRGNAYSAAKQQTSVGVVQPQASLGASVPGFRLPQMPPSVCGGPSCPG